MRTGLVRSALAMGLTLLAASGCRSTSSPEATAERYMKLAIAGDMIPLHSMLAAPDQEALPREHFPDNLPDGVDLSPNGRMSTTLDSVQTVKGAGTDTVVVDAYLTGPNVGQIAGQFILGAMAAAGSGKEVNKADVEKAVASAPRVTQVERLTLVREQGGWRVWLGVRARQELAKKYALLKASYLEQPLSKRAVVAREFLALAQKSPTLFREHDKKDAEQVVRHAAYVDSLTVDVTAERSLIGGVLTGTVENRASSPLEDVWAEVRDENGETAKLMNIDVPAKSTKRVTEMGFLAPGKLSATILDLKIPGEDE